MHSEIITESESAETILTEPTLTEWDPISLTQYRVIRRHGELTQFDANKIAAAMTKAFLAVEGHTAMTSNRIHNTVRHLTQQVIKGIRRRLLESGTVHIEEIQDQVELALMRAGEHKVARAYVIYREEHAHQRAIRKEKTVIHVTNKQGQRYPLDEERLRTVVAEACAHLEDVHAEIIIEESLRNLFDGILEVDVNRALVMSARSLIEKEPNYTYVAARLLLDHLRGEAFSFVQLNPTPVISTQLINYNKEYFKIYLKCGIQYELLDPRLAEFDLDQLGNALVAERDWQFTYLGLQTLYDRYFLHWQETRFELPQAFFMRVAMGLALNETKREIRAIEFYNLLSCFDLMTSTPTLFNSGTLRPQLSSCFLSTIPDSAEGIMGAITDNALLSKHAGGIGNDWTPVRGMGAHIKGTNGKSGGVVPFMKIANDGLVAFNQCFSPDTLIITNQGMIKIKDIKVGDLVLSKNGKFNKVLDVFSYTDSKPMRSIEVKHSLNPLVVSDNHPFFAIKASKYDTPQRVLERLISSKISPEWIPAKHLEKNDYVSQVIPNVSIKVPGFTLDDARLYGIMLGDGHCYKSEQEWETKFEWGVSGSSKKMPMLNFVKSYLENHGVHYWTAERGNYIQIKWAYSKKVIRDGTTGKFLCRDQPVMPFDYADLYNQNKEKHISYRLANLPLSISIGIIAGLIETDGNIHDGKEITLSNTSLPLINDLRYQCLRLGIPTAGYVKPRANNSHYGQRSDGTVVYFDHTKFKPAYVLRIPAISELAELVSCKPLTKYNWFIFDNLLFTRIKSCEDIPSIPMVYDLKVDVDPTYMTDSALVHNSGKRRGSGCAYLETWHIDIEEFLELRKNTGDERRRTHDMNTANWIPDLFLERVHENQPWTLFSPDEVPQLHDLYGTAFKNTYETYEESARQGQIKIWKQVSAIELWRKMLTMLYETGHPWLCFKDPCNLRNPQQHVGVVHSSNLCTEITLNTSSEEIGVCNLASINLSSHIREGQLDLDKLQQTIRIGMRMLDNVIDINYYSVPQAKTANLRHRPVGLGIMGFQDALYQLRVPYASEPAVEFADYTQEVISYYAILASTELAQERGHYSTFKGSLWSQGILPIDSINLLAQVRGHYLDMSTTMTLDWDSLRERVKTVGMRNSNCMAVAPTATISLICGVTQSIEPTYQNLFIKSNLSGEFTVINPYLVRDLKALGLWDEVMVNDLKYCDGSIREIERISPELKALYATAFEIDPNWLVEAASRRQKWLDQSQSLNLYMLEPSGRKLDQLYRLAWLRGLKTTYYLRSLGATRVQKSTVSHFNTMSNIPQACALEDPECEACQ